MQKIPKLISSIFITLFLIYILIKTTYGKIIIIPFLLASFSNLGINISILSGIEYQFKFFHKLFILSFFIFWFGFLIYSNYYSFTTNNYQMIFFEIPFWIIGIIIFKRKLKKR